MKKIVCIALSLLLLAGVVEAKKRPSATAKKVNAAAFEKDYQALMDSLQLVGVSVAVVKNNQIIYTHSFGKKNLATGEPVTDNTLFRIASISKSFTATTIMQLAEQGKVDITVDVSRCLPFRVQNENFPTTPITLEMMMSHTSSINDSQGYWTSFDPIDPRNAPDHLKCYNFYQPGTGYEYCNFNFNIMACVIEKVTGQRWYQYEYEHILKPLGIDGGFSVDDLDRSRFATLYDWDGKKYEEQPEAYHRPEVLDNYQLCVSSPRLSAAGGMKITARGLAQYMLMHMNYGKSPLAKSRIISEASSRRMQTVITDHADANVARAEKERAGLGLVRTDEYTPGVELVGHTGGAYGLRSAMFFNPEKKYGFVVMCSGTTSSKVLQKSLTLMYQHFIGALPKK